LEQFEEKSNGSLKVDKLANKLILSVNPLTIKEGKPVYRCAK
jgi:hypothetical protein